MEFSYVVYYAILNFIFFCFLLYKHSLLSSGIIVSAFYVFVAILAVPAYNLLPNDEYFCIYNFTDIKVLPYILYFLLSTILIAPIFKYDGKFQQLSIYLHTTRTKAFILFFIICSFASILIYGRMILEHSVFDNLDEIRQNHYEGIQIVAYENQLEHFALLFTHYFSLPAKILFFYLLTFDDQKPNLSGLFILFLGIGIFLPELMDATRTASRGMIISVFFELILCYSIFRNNIDRNKKTLLFLSSIISAILMMIYSLMVTEARFGQNDEANSISSLICYWGQPTLIFNSQVSQIENFAWGARFFYPVFEMFGAQPDLILSSINQGWGVCFTTLVGDIWQDVGIFTIIIIPFISWLFYKWIKNRTICGLAEIYIMIFYALTIQKGALVTGYGMCLNITIAIVMYIFLKYFFSLKIGQ